MTFDAIETAKPWGVEHWIDTHNNKYMVKLLHMKDGQRCSYQYHKEKTETVIVLSGELTVILEGVENSMRPKDVLTIQPGQKHRMWAKNGDCWYAEASTNHPDDTIRIEDDYSRV